MPRIIIETKNLDEDQLDEIYNVLDDNSIPYDVFDD